MGESEGKRVLVCCSRSMAVLTQTVIGVVTVWQVFHTCSGHGSSLKNSWKKMLKTLSDISET